MGSTNSKQALVVDDDPDVRGALAEFLKGQGFAVEEAVNGLEALVYVKRHRPGLILLDLAMPRLGGLDALKRIRGFDAGIAVVIVTGHDDDELRRQAHGLGAKAFLRKPLDFEALKRIVHSGATAELAPARPGAAAAAPFAEASSFVDRRGRILVVDDDPDVVSALQDLLAGAGYAVRTATDGGGAIRAVVEAAPDVVLLDIEMPGLSGVEALATIRAVAPEVRVVMLSGITDPQLAKRALAFGAFEYVPKPFDVRHLLDMVATVLAHKALDAE